MTDPKLRKRRAARLATVPALRNEIEQFKRLLAEIDQVLLRGPFEKRTRLDTIRGLVARVSGSRVRLPETRAGMVRKLTIQTSDGGLDCYVIVGLYPDGRPGELFLKVAKEGSLLSGFADALAMAMSVGLQYGVPLSVYTGKLRHMRFEPSGPTGNPEQPLASSLLDLLAGWLERRFLPPKETP